MPDDDAQTAPVPIKHRNLPLLLLKAREAVLARFRPILHHFGLTDQQWRVMRTIFEHQEMEPRQICETAQILSPSLTGMLVRMEEQGLVERRRMAEDQRRVLVRLTPKSNEMVASILPLVEAQYALVEERLGPPLVGELYELLDRLLTHDMADIPTVDLPPTTPSERKASLGKAAPGVRNRSVRPQRG